ncbi:MAG: hypothetical protein H6970_05670 [Gammaproteobacteria bacterium]|nr:hypothetical protein [Gammaproteobacteria bacterium]MCP5458533.1 hypothetical protein [Gammaproteobacteria bacterium]
MNSTASAQEVNHSDLSATIAVPLHDGSRMIDLYSPDNHFHVILSNHSDTVLHLWREWCSWGHYNLSFEITDEQGKTWIVSKQDKNWTKNFPDFLELSPAESLVFDVNFNPKIWKDSPISGASGSKKVVMRAIYRVEASDESKKAGVWTGEIASPAQEYVLNW